MKTFIRTLSLCLAMSLTLIANAQLVNCNPDPNGEPWWAGDLPEITPEIQAELDAITPLVISNRSSTTVLPPLVDNSQELWFRPVFLQNGGCCGQASGVGYTFTYEVNRIRNVSGSLPENQYPTHFTWNFLNKQDSSGGSWYYQGWDVIKQMGVPTVDDYGGMYKPNLQSDAERANVWETGYEKYKEALNNKVITEYHYIDVSTPAGLDALKHWLNDHGSGEDSGGLANFAAKISNANYGTLPSESNETGKKIVIGWGNSGLHAMTIVGYDDNVKYDFNGDGQYTNSNPNDMTTWEIGALKVANSWGSGWLGNGGFVYMPYQLLAKPHASGGIYTNENDTQKHVHVVSVASSYAPEMTLKVKIDHACRKKLKLFAGRADNANQSTPINSVQYCAFNRPPAWSGAGCLPMQGINEDPIELCLDYGQFYNLDNVGKVYFTIYQSSGQHNGTVSDFSLIDYRWDEVFELPYPGSSPVPIVNNGYTRLGIPYHLLPFENPIQNNLTLATDRVARRTVKVDGNSTLTINEGVNLDMYGTEAHYCKLQVENGSSLVIGNNAIITAKRGDCEIVVNGNIQIGQGVTFKAENGATLAITINGQQTIVIDGCTFENATLLAAAGTAGTASLTNASSISVSNCTFRALGIQCEYALRVDGYSSIMLTDNTVNGVGLMSSRFYTDGILLYNCGTSGIGSQILRNTIKGCTDTGLTLYGTTADIKGKNEITQCFTGVKLLNGSTVNNFMGNCGASNASQTQYIHDNDNSEVYIYRDCMPQTFRFNCITNSGNGWFVEYEDNVDNGKGLCTRLDLEYNTWGNYTNTQIGNHFHHITNTNNCVVFDFLPKWSYGECLSNYEEEAQRKSVEADSLWNIGLYTSAKVSYKEIVTLYPNTSSALNAMKKLLLIEGNDGENYAGLHYYYLNDTTIQGNESLSALAGSLANKCDEFMEHYEQAIAWYEDIIENEETPYNDSIFATIDLGNLYLKMEGSGAKGAKGKLTQFVPKSAEAFAKQTDEALRKLKNVSRRINSTRELPEQYWTNLVTEQPEGYVVDFNGDVHLYSAEALAWLISVVNGLNGQEADDFNGKKVTLEANVDMSTALWIPIADGTNLGDPNPDKLKFCGTFDGNGFAVNNLILFHNPNYENFESFFGNLCGARIENVVLRHVYAEGRNERDGKFFGSAESIETEEETRPNVIDRCYVEIDELRKNGNGIESALFGFKNDGIITNCMVKLGKLSYPGNNCEIEGLFVYFNYGTVQNCASVADSLKWMWEYGGMAIENHGLIENCYSYIDNWFGDYPCWWPPTPRMGAAEANYGTIRHCYYNTFNYHEGGGYFDDAPVSYNEGTIENAVPFEPTPYFQSPYWVFDDTVSVQSHTGFIYKTLRLEEALNDWILGQENSDDYEYWCASPYCSIFVNHLPSFSGIDITDIRENKANNEHVMLYPNPTNGFVHIDGIMASEVQVYNIYGQLVKIVLGTNELNLIGLTDGMYLLRISDEKGINYTERIIITK